MADDCVFCQIAAFEDVEKGKVIMDLPSTFVMEPLHPVVPGHVLVIPRRHTADATANPGVAAETMKVACEYARTIGDCNIITSVGTYASQSVFHLHIHVVPREADDGLPLPWGKVESSEQLEEDAAGE